MSVTYYFISDLHIGGDEALGVCDFEAELIRFLDEIANKKKDIELIIIGDAFGLWELTNIHGIDKFNAIINQFPNIFNAFYRAGEKIKITLLPGNHDYELACYPDFVKALKKYNIRLEQAPAITRSIANRRLWIEHGSQYDEANCSPSFGDPYALPVGYFITSNMVGKAGQLSGRGRHNWLKDIQSVYPTEMIPDWIMSNYFYHEMSPLLRWLAMPFLLLSGLTLFVLAGAFLEYFNITGTNIFLDNSFFNSLGMVGSLFQIILMINAVVLLMALALSLPLGFILRDLKRTLIRFGIELDPAQLTGEKEDSYIHAAGKVFTENQDIVAFIYGHTHKPSLQQIDDRLVINTGTWLKRFERTPPRFGILPSIYVPVFCLNYFRVYAEDTDIIIDYCKIDKSPEIELTLIQHLMVSRKRSSIDSAIAEKTVIHAAEADIT